jgi:hypothetical protein
LQQKCVPPPLLGMWHLFVTSLVHLSGHEYRSSPFVLFIQVMYQKVLYSWKNMSRNFIQLKKDVTEHV